MKTGEYRSRLLPGRKAQLSFDLMFAIIMVLFLVQLLAVVIGENNRTSQSFEQMSLGAPLANNIADQMSAVNTAWLSSGGDVEAVIGIPDNGLYEDEDSGVARYTVRIHHNPARTEGCDRDVIVIDQVTGQVFTALTSLNCDNIGEAASRDFTGSITLVCEITGCTCI
jgi:hypothetical protein